nr:hypothetical protein [uncultured Roseovarius sp.]
MTITIGTEKQIAYAESIIANRAHPNCGGNFYMIEGGISLIEEARKIIVDSEVPQDLKDRAEEVIEILPRVASFWINVRRIDQVMEIIESVIEGGKGHCSIQGVIRDVSQNI